MSLADLYEEHRTKFVTGLFVLFTLVMLYVMHPTWFS